MQAFSALICTKIEIFRPELESNMLKQDKKSNAGAKPFDVIMMFKIILLKRYYHLSDEQTEYQIIDRLSFKEFLGLFGIRTLTKSVRRTLMLAGHKKADKNFTVTKTTLKLTGRANLLIHIKLRVQKYTTVSQQKR
jgi:hypothetical protein